MCTPRTSCTAAAATAATLAVAAVVAVAAATVADVLRRRKLIKNETANKWHVAIWQYLSHKCEGCGGWGAVVAAVAMLWRCCGSAVAGAVAAVAAQTELIKS